LNLVQHNNVLACVLHTLYLGRIISQDSLFFFLVLRNLLIYVVKYRTVLRTSPSVRKPVRARLKKAACKVKLQAPIGFGYPSPEPSK
jgi:hypothetical protein